MNDTQTTVQELRQRMAQFIQERDWQQFHNPKSLSMCLAAEAAELMELFLWCTNDASHEIAQNRAQEMKDELADIVICAINFANATGIDISKAVEQKMAKNGAKYPVEKAKGRSEKYNEL